MESVLLDVSPHQMRALADTKVIHLRPEFIDVESGIEVRISPEKVKRLRKAKRANRGMRFSMTSEELSATKGAGMWKTMRGRRKKIISVPKPLPLYPPDPVVIDAEEKPMNTGRGKSMKGGKKTTIHATPFYIPARHPLVDVGNMEYGSRYIRGSGILGPLGPTGEGGEAPGSRMAGPAPFIGSSSPASRPLIDVGNLQYGTHFIRSF